MQEVVLKMPFFILSNPYIQIAEKKPTWSSYVIKKSLLTTWKVKLIIKFFFAKTALNKNVKAFVIYVASLTFKITIYQNSQTKIALLLPKKSPF